MRLQNASQLSIGNSLSMQFIIQKPGYKTVMSAKCSWDVENFVFAWGVAMFRSAFLHGGCNSSFLLSTDEAHLERYNTAGLSRGVSVFVLKEAFVTLATYILITHLRKTKGAVLIKRFQSCCHSRIIYMPCDIHIYTHKCGLVFSACFQRLACRSWEDICGFDVKARAICNSHLAKQ